MAKNITQLQNSSAKKNTISDSFSKNRNACTWSPHDFLFLPENIIGNATVKVFLP